MQIFWSFRRFLPTLPRHDTNLRIQKTIFQVLQNLCIVFWGFRRFRRKSSDSPGRISRSGGFLLYLILIFCPHQYIVHWVDSDGFPDEQLISVRRFAKDNLYLVRLLTFVASPFAHCVIMVVMSWERYILVCRATDAGTILSRGNRAKVCSAATLLIISLSAVCIFFFNKCVSVCFLNL